MQDPLSPIRADSNRKGHTSHAQIAGYPPVFAVKSCSQDFSKTGIVVS